MLDAEKKAGAKDAMDTSIALLLNVLEQQGVSYEQFAVSI